MKIILNQDVPNLGEEGDVCVVKDGYARNYLMKNNLAIPYTEGSKKVLNSQLAQRQKEEDAKKAEAEKVKEQLAKTPIEFHLKTGKEGQAFGSVSSKNIVQALNQKGIAVNKQKIRLEQPITSLGTTRVKVDLYKNQVIGEIVVRVREK